MDSTSLLLQPLHGSAADGRSWSGFTESVPQSVQTTALRISSLETETRSFTQVIGEDSRRQKAWKDYLNSGGSRPLEECPPPDGELCNPIRYFADKSTLGHEPTFGSRERVKTHPVDEEDRHTCYMKLDVNNTLYRVIRDGQHNIIDKQPVGQFDDERSRGHKMAALLHSVQGQGHIRKPRNKLHSDFMTSVTAFNRGEVPLHEYVIQLGHETVDGEEKYTSFARTKYPDSTGTIYHVSVDFYDDKVSGLHPSE